MITKIAGYMTGVILAITAAVAFAHHPFAAEFDWKKPVTLTGTVEKFQWANPHSLLFIDAKDASGVVKRWELELGNPLTLTRLGWKQTTLKAGEVVTVDGWLARDGTNRANLKSTKLANGTEMLTGSSLLDTSSEIIVASKDQRK